MNDELIFVKTSSGEDAVRDRTRLVQRNLRMVLILVDGLTNVAALKHKAGDPAMIETALAELERIGLIESVATRGTRHASTVADAAAIAGEPQVVAVDAYEDFPTIDTVFEDVASETSNIGADTPVPTEVPSLQGTAVKRSTDLSVGWFSRMRQRWLQMREERTYEVAYGKPNTSDAGAFSSPRRYPRRRLNLKAIMSFVLIGIVVVGSARVVFYPYDEYRPAFEARLSKMFADRVTIGNVRLSFAPFPVLVLERVVVGSDADTTAATVTLVPDPRLVLGGQQFRAAKVSGLNIKEGGINKLSKWFLPGSIGDLQLDQVEVDSLSVDLGWMQIRGLSGTLKLDHGGAPTFTGKTGRGDVQVEAVPVKAGLRISAMAGPWIVPVDPPLKLAALDFSGTLSPGQLLMDKVDARVFDGLVSGSGVMVWQSAPKITLDLALKHVGAAQLLEAVRAPVLVDGELAGQVQYVSNAPSASWLNQNSKAEGSVVVIRGGLKRIDLAGALKGGGAQRNAPRRGGETGFEDLAGKFTLDAGSVRFGGVRLSSGLLLASGQAIVSRETGIMSGTANVEMRGSASAPRASLSITGNARDPELKAAR